MSFRIILARRLLPGAPASLRWPALAMRSASGVLDAHVARAIAPGGYARGVTPRAREPARPLLLAAAGGGCCVGVRASA